MSLVAPSESPEPIQFDDLFSAEMLLLLQNDQALDEVDLPTVRSSAKRGRPAKLPGELKPNTVYKKLKTLQTSILKEVEEINAVGDEANWGYSLKVSVSIEKGFADDPKGKEKAELLIKKMAFIKLQQGFHFYYNIKYLTIKSSGILSLIKGFLHYLGTRLEFIIQLRHTTC